VISFLKNYLVEERCCFKNSRGALHLVCVHHRARPFRQQCSCAHGISP